MDDVQQVAQLDQVAAQIRRLEAMMADRIDLLSVQARVRLLELRLSLYDQLRGAVDHYEDTGELP